jgi:hypothetical protein
MSLNQEIKTIGAPTGGVNARDALAAMPDTDCIVGDNMFGTTSYVQSRNGNASWGTGMTTAVETVMAYNGFVVRKLFAAANNKFYDITVQGAGVATTVTGTSNNRWQHQMFNAGGGNILIAVNGSDAPRRYDGGTQGSITSLVTLVGGAAYVNGTYTNVPLTGGAGTGAQGTFVVAGGAVTSVVITAVGANYVVGNVLGVNNASLGGAGAGFSYTVETVGGWSTTTIAGSGLTATNLITITIHQQRCWYIEKNTMNAWYSGPSAFQGTLTKLPLGQLFKFGGTLMQMATWTVDNAAGMNDWAAFMTSEGEVAIYQGYDPSSAATWVLVGVFRTGRPIGRRCWAKYGSDVVMITTDGLAPMSKLMSTDRSQNGVNLTDKISTAVNSDIGDFVEFFGWQVIVYPIGTKLFLNVPEVENSTAHQWVMNTVANSWWRFKSWNANCFEVQGDFLYFGGNGGIVYLADTGTSDSSIPITIDCKPAFTSFGSPGQQKVFAMAQPIFQATAQIVTPIITLNVDFEDVINQSPLLSVSSQPLWDVSLWDVTSWGGANYLSKDWEGVSGEGNWVSGRLSMQLKGLTLFWFCTNYMYEPGGPV